MQGAKTSSAGPERFVLALALLVPLGLMAVGLQQLMGLNAAPGGTPAYADSSSRLVVQRPASSAATAPPTLAAPTATAVPTMTAVPAATAAPTTAPTPAPTTNRTYTVQRGDELKNIAAQYGVSIWTIIDANEIPNPDSLRVGQVLHIPD